MNLKQSKHICSSCRRGEKNIEADGLYTGTTSEGLPFRGKLCRFHVDIMCQDGARLTIMTAYTKDGARELCDELWDQYTDAKERFGVNSYQANRIHKRYCEAQNQAGLNA